MSLAPLGSMLHAKNNTPATRSGDCAASTIAMQAPSLHPTSVARSMRKRFITATTSDAIN